jgi:hypothetical protein
MVNQYDIRWTRQNAKKPGVLWDEISLNDGGVGSYELKAKKGDIFAPIAHTLKLHTIKG